MDAGQNYNVVENKPQDAGNKIGDFVSNKSIFENRELEWAIGEIETKPEDNKRGETIAINDSEDKDYEKGKNMNSNVRWRRARIPVKNHR